MFEPSSRALLALFALAAALLCVNPGVLKADALMGNVGAVLATPYGVSANPANAGFVPTTEAQMGGSVVSTKAKFRVPFTPPVSKNYKGISFSDIPATVIKRGNVGFSVMGGMLNARLSGQANKMPILLLNQMNYLDVDAAITHVSFAQVSAGVKIFDRLGLGLAGTYVNAAGEVSITPSGTDQPLATVHFSDVQLMSIRIGFRFDLIPRKLMIGVATDAYSKMKIGNFDVRSSLADDLQNAGGGSGTDGVQMPQIDTSALMGSSASGLNRWLFGAGAILGPLSAYADFDYRKKPANTQTFSMAKMKVCEGDYHDAVSFRGGGKIHVPRRIFSPFHTPVALLGGVQYEPSNMGPGTAGPDGLAGFSPMALVATNFTQGPIAMATEMTGAMGGMGFNAVAPFWAVGGGTELSLWKTKQKVDGERIYSLSLIGGGYYREESLGVDDQGDHPFAFEKKVFGATGYLIYRF